MCLLCVGAVECGTWYRLIKEEHISSDVEERTEEVREVCSLLQ